MGSQQLPVELHWGREGGLLLPDQKVMPCWEFPTRCLFLIFLSFLNSLSVFPQGRFTVLDPLWSSRVGVALVPEGGGLVSPQLSLSPAQQVATVCTCLGETEAFFP